MYGSFRRRLGEAARAEAETRLRRRITEIEDSLARPAEDGMDWGLRRDALQRELDALRNSLARAR